MQQAGVLTPGRTPRCKTPDETSKSPHPEHTSASPACPPPPTVLEFLCASGPHSRAEYVPHSSSIERGCRHEAARRFASHGGGRVACLVFFAASAFGSDVSSWNVARVTYLDCCQVRLNTMERWFSRIGHQAASICLFWAIPSSQIRLPRLLRMEVY